MKEEMEMPTPCQHCGEWFDLHDGCGSEKWYPGTVICETCSNEEDEEIMVDNEVEQLSQDIEEAEFTLKEAYARLAELGRPRSKVLIFNNQ